MSSKTRTMPASRPAMTPQRSKQSAFSLAEKQSLLDNFDLEVADKTRAFQASLSATLESFLRRQETEILKIPRDLRGMTLVELEDKWGGSWRGTVQRLARDRLEEQERRRIQEEEEQARLRREVEAETQGKR